MCHDRHVTSALIYIVVMALVAAVVFLLAALVFGRGEELAPLPPGASPTRLPAGGVTPEDVRELRFQQVLRGYKMTEVDWAVERLAGEVERLRARVAELEAETGRTPVDQPDGRAADRAADGSVDRAVDRPFDRPTDLEPSHGRPAREAEHDRA
ncbi:hypothetical protein GCM10009634_70350 [Saccharothrix xinjiangensis]